MAEVAASVALAEAGAPAATPAPAAPAAKTVDFSDGRTVSFVDQDGAADPADTILDEVLAGKPADDAEEPAETTEAKADGEEKTDAKPAEPTKVEAKTEPAPDAEALKLRRGFAKLAEERQKLVERENEARATIASAQQYAEKARKHDELISNIEKDPAGFLLAHGGETLVQKALQGFIDQEKSPAEREIAKLRAEREQEKAEEAKRRTDEQVAAWQTGVISRVQADERFDLVNSMGLHKEVIEVMGGYTEKYSERNAKGEITKLALIPWDVAAEAVELSRASQLEKSKRYGKRQPAAAAETTAKKETPSAKQSTAPAKKAPTSLSSVPVADSPQHEEDLPSDDNDERERRLLAQLGL